MARRAIYSRAKYSADYPDRVIELMAEGASFVEVAADLGAAIPTFNRWRDSGEHPDFTEACSIGLGLSEAWWQRLGREAADSRREINAAVWIFNMKNRFRWRDRVDTALSSDGPIQIVWPLPKSELDD